MMRLPILVLAVLAVCASVRADEQALRARREALGAIAEGEQDLAHAADAAIERARSDRDHGDEAAAVRAEHIAEATLSLIERRRARHEAEASLTTARSDRDAMRARLEQARTAAAGDDRESARLDAGAP